MNAREYLGSLVGQTIETYRGRPNTVIRIEGSEVIVGTARSPAGTPVPIAWVQSALDRLEGCSFPPARLRALAHRFDRGEFERRFAAWVDDTRRAQGAQPA